MELVSKLVAEKIDSYRPSGGLSHISRFVIALASINHKNVIDHMQRVALLSESVAIAYGSNPKAAFFSGLLHDVGKLIQVGELFDGHDISQEEYEEVKCHAKAGFESLRHIHGFVALCAGLHHAVGEHGYGLTEHDFPDDWSQATIHLVMEISFIISICDFIDAFKTRCTCLKGGSGANCDDLRGLLVAKYIGQEKLIDVALKQAESHYKC